MADLKIRVVDSQETFFFSRVQGVLRQWIEVTLDNPSNHAIACVVAITAGEEKVETQVELLPGRRTYRCYASVLWPEKPPEEHAVLQVEAGGEKLIHDCRVGFHRPWVLYALSDVCTDATWTYDKYAAVRKDDADLTAAELCLAEAMRGGISENSNHYNLVHALELEYFEEFYPEMVERLAEAMRRNEITLNPFYNMTLTYNVSLEEQIRLFYKAREWALKYGLEMNYANHQETPSIAWDMAGILAGCGVDYLVKGILPYECPWAARLAEPPIFLWEGPDGSRIKIRRRNQDYAEAHCLLKGLEETNHRLHEQTIPEFEAWGARYPFNAIGLVGVYSDLVRAEPGKLQSRDFPVIKAATIAHYNSQGWEYPRLINASHDQFWREIDRQIAQRGIELEISKGDYGLGWDVWPACLAYDAAGWRRAQERSGLADKLAAILSRCDPAWYARNRAHLEDGWKHLKMLADHAWNGASETNRILNARLRREWQTRANAEFDGVISRGLQALADQVAGGGAEACLVFNGLGWSRDGLVSLPGLGEEASFVDAVSGDELLWQRDADSGETFFLAKDVPSVGYRTFARAENKAPKKASPFTFGANRLEGPYYILEVSPVTGGITRLYDKMRAKELVDAASQYHLNQCLYFSDESIASTQPYPLLHAPKAGSGVEYASTFARTETGADGPLFASLVISAQVKDLTVRSTLTLYAHEDRLDIKNEIVKPVSEERQQLDFAFPFHMPERRIRLEQPGVILNPDDDTLPGAGLSAAVLRHFVDVYNADYGVTLSMADTFTVQFGHRTTTEDPHAPDPSATIFALALGNIYDANEAIRDQAGVEKFIFNFSLRGHPGGFDPVKAVRFAWESSNPLEAVRIGSGREGFLPAMHSFISVEPDTAILAGMKPAEDMEAGLIARVWEVGRAECGANLRLAVPSAPASAMLTDHLERDQVALEIEDGAAKVPVRPRGVSTARFSW